MAKGKIEINRAPVLTLWAAVVAERLGYDTETALTLGKAVAGLNAQSKGRRLGIYAEKTEEEKEQVREEAAAGKVEFVQIMGRPVPVVETPRGLRAAIKGEAIHAESVEKYLKQKFGADLDAAQEFDAVHQAGPVLDANPHPHAFNLRLGERLGEEVQQTVTRAGVTSREQRHAGRTLPYHAGGPLGRRRTSLPSYQCITLPPETLSACPVM